ncbi:TldD/PmbA family protein [Euhalothece natronophila Z-M001]|uniref:TldD/PmbA family protein n=1 Tax=Euhalothece natronophila Z-M001 TaxID=522448 RepID=A0A5B8NP55_9CHRO|nr:TldD/PmbA family protein [Euhalothece natronophila]QDZ39975.1 TldD/PmbA family protein [Euhalothece natronophila Z-M001]
MINPEELLDKAQQAGVDEAEVYQLVSHSQAVYFEANDLKQLETNESEGVALRIWRDRAPSVTVAYGDIDLETFVNRTLALCELNPPETIELTPDHRQVYPTQGKAMSRETLVETGKSAIAQLHKSYPRLLCKAELECEQQTTRILNTKGTDCQYSDISLSAFIEAEWVRGEDFFTIADGVEASESLDLRPTQQRITEGIKFASHIVPSPKGRVPIIFTAKAAPLFWDTLVSALNGKRVWEGSSPWSERLNQQVISPQITLFQDPTQLPQRCPFDDEGTPTQKLMLIQEGRLEQFYSDRAIGCLLETGTTGNGFRPSLGRYPTPGLVNLIVENGKGQLQDLISQLDEGLVIDQLLGEDADLSGEFSANIELGYRIQNGEIIGRVKDTMVAGNIYTALNHLITLGGDSEINGAYKTPSVVVDGLSVVS